MVNRVIRNLFFLQAGVLFSALTLFSLFLGPTHYNFWGVMGVSFLASLCASFTAYLLLLKMIGEAVADKSGSDEAAARNGDQIQAYNRLGTILSRMVEGVIVIDSREKVLTLSQPLIDMLDLRLRQAVGRPYWEVVRNEEINSLLKETIAQKSAQKKELEIWFPNESYFSVQTSPILNDRKELLGVVAVFHDITELKRLEKIRSEFVANVSHELKTPLTSIKGFVETLMSGAMDDGKSARRFLEIIQKHTERLENLVTDLLSLSSIESREASWNFEPVGISEIIGGVVSLHKERMEQKKQKLDIQIPKDLPKALGDRMKIEEVFSNLIDNAVKFTPESGSITIAAEEKDFFVCVSVKDSGIGIAPEHLQRVFERFYRVDKSRSRDSGGTGLGLSIVKHIVQAHNGKVEVDSQPDKGATFFVFLPKAA